MSDETIVLEPVSAGAEDTCAKCGTTRKKKVDWCTRCGFHARFGTFVELEDWEKDPDPEAPPVVEEKPRTNPLSLVPAWGWKLMGILAGVVAVSILGRFVTPPDSTARLVWALGELAIGGLVFLTGHIASYIAAAMENDRLNVMDILLKPVAIWLRIVHDLPTGFWRLATVSGGLLAGVLALTVVGGIPYSKIWGDEPVKKAKANLLQAITDAARKAEGGADNLEDAVKDFAGKADDLLDKRPPDPRKMSADCVIAGYVPAAKDDFSALVMVSQVDGKVKCVGALDAEIPPEVRADLNRKLRQIEREKPFVPCDGVAGAHWVDPRYMCRVKFKEWSENRRMISPAFDGMLDEIDTR